MSSSLTATAPVQAAPSGMIQSLQRGLKVFEYVCTAARPVVAKQVAVALDLNLSTAYHLLNTLVFEGYVQRSDDRTFVVAAGGLARLRGCGEGLSGERLKAQRAVGRAAFAVEGISAICSLNGVEAVIREVGEVPGVDAPHRLRRGCRHVAHASVVGRAALAAASAGGELRGVLDELEAVCREHGELMHPLETERAIEAIRAGEPAVDTSDGFLWVALPVSGRDGFSFALTVGRPLSSSGTRDRQQLPLMVKAVERTACQLSSVLGPNTFVEEG
jgi:DNA-binding IclR family transcriptional regulator